MTTNDEPAPIDLWPPYQGCIVGGLIGVMLPGLYFPGRRKTKPL